MARLALIVFVLATLSSGCATLVRGSSEPILVEADQDSAYVFVDGLPVGPAPGEFVLRRTKRHRVEVVREGFRIAGARVERTLNPVAAGGSLLFGGLSSVAIDASTGAIYDLNPDIVRVVLERDTAGSDIVLVAERLAAARTAAALGYPAADPTRRKDPPWLVVQTSSGVFVGRTETRAATESQDAVVEDSGGLGVGVTAGRRTQGFSVIGRALISGGVFFDNSERWELGLLAGPVTEAFEGRLRLAASAGAGISGGRENTSCFLCGGSSADRPRDKYPTRIGIAGQLDLFAFPIPQVGLGVQIPVNYTLDDTAVGVLVGLRFEGM